MQGRRNQGGMGDLPLPDFGRKVNPIPMRGQIKSPLIFRTSYGPAMLLHLFVPVRENVSNKFDSTKLSIIKAFINLCEGEIFHLNHYANLILT